MAAPPDIQTDTKRLAELFHETKAFQYSPDRPFRLVSGATSPYYFDLKLLSGDPEGVSTAARVLYHTILQMPEVQSVGGLAAGSIPIATAISQHSWLEHKRDESNHTVTSFFVRKEQKKHGTGKRIEGVITPPAVILDDVITSGQSAIAAVDAVREAGYECRCLLGIVFRGTEQQRAEIERHAPLRYIFHQDKFINPS